VGADGTLNMTDTHMLANQAGGVGQSESSGVFAEVSQEGRMERAQHLLCVGKAVIERCTFEGVRSNSIESELANGAKLFLVGKQTGHILLVNSNMVGSKSEAVIGLFGAAEAVLRGCTTSGMTIDPDVLVDGQLGVVNSTFDPPLDSSPLALIECRAVQSAVVAGERLCDPRAVCEPRPSGGLQCACFGEGLRYKPGVLEDGRQCEQDASLRSVLESGSLAISASKPSNVTSHTLHLIVEAQGEAEFATAFNITITRETHSGTLISTNNSIRIDQPSVSAFGQNLEWKIMPPNATLNADLDGSKLKYYGDEATRVRCAPRLQERRAELRGRRRPHHHGHPAAIAARRQSSIGGDGCDPS